jgi:hypothetical protein
MFFSARKVFRTKVLEQQGAQCIPQFFLPVSLAVCGTLGEANALVAVILCLHSQTLFDNLLVRMEAF